MLWCNSSAGGSDVAQFGVSEGAQALAVYWVEGVVCIDNGVFFSVCLSALSPLSGFLMTTGYKLS